MKLQRRAPLLFIVVAWIVATVGCRSREQRHPGPYGDEVAHDVPLIEKSVGLTFKRPPRVELRSKAQVREFVLRELESPRSVREMTGVEAAYKRFGLIPDTLYLREFLVSLLEEQIVGYYDPTTKVLYVVRDAPHDMAGVTLTHELVHALQDQYVDLKSFQDLEGANDRQTAAQSVFEGQAVFEQLAVMFGGGNVAVNLPGGWDRVRDMIRDNRASMPIFAAAPLIVQETLIFPYLTGAEFVRNFKARRPGESMYDDMPVSTEQVLHPSAYFGKRDTPTTVTLPAPRGTKVYENTLGEFETRVLLFDYLNDQGEAIRGAAGWDGDRYVLVRTSAGEALVWVTVWDSAVDAGEYRDVLERGLEKRLKISGSGATTDRTFSAGGRSIRLRTLEIAGRAAVLYADTPAGVAIPLDPALIRLRE